MNAVFLSRAHGSTGPQSFQRYYTARLLHALQPAPSIVFNGPSSSSTPAREERESHKRKAQDIEAWRKPAHPTGVNTLTIDKFEWRYLLSGGADSSIYLWDLESELPNSRSHTHRPTGVVKKSPSTHKFGITHLTFFPLDPDVFFSSSYDHTLKIYRTETLAVVESYDLDAVVYSHDVSPSAHHQLVACATQNPHIRLVDPRSGASTHSLAGHHGAVLSVAWSPRHEYILASGASDGMVRLWDIRRGAASLGVFDADDALGSERSHRPRDQGKSHSGACNGVRWSEDGEYIISVGRDEQVRVWDASTGANTLAQFGPMVKNPHSATLLPLIIPSHITTVGQRVMFYPNGKELLMFDMFEGTLLKRLRVSGAVEAPLDLTKGSRNVDHRIMATAFRANHIEIYSAHSDGFIRFWAPRTLEDADIDEEEVQNSRKQDDGDERQKKRQELDRIFRDLARRPITFT